MTKEYLKMTDVFPFSVQFDSDGGIGAVVDSQGEYIAQAMENNYCSHMSNKDKNGYRNKVARYVAHSVASHDELVSEVERLRVVVDGVIAASKSMQDRKPLTPWGDGFKECAVSIERAISGVMSGELSVFPRDL